MLSQEQIDFYQENGYLMVDNVISKEDIANALDDINHWIEESRQHDSAYGVTIDGRPRFDLEKDHSPNHPSLRRIASPTEISPNFAKLSLASEMAIMANELIGKQGTRFHHSKINAKLPNTATLVKWHQDFLFTPHTNDDLVTALLMLTEVTPENGPLQVIPGSHKGELYSHWHDGHFTGQVADSVIDKHCQNPVLCTGKPGSVCFMHTRLLHSSAPNHTLLPRTLFITVYSAEDALPLSENPLPSRHQRQLVAGTSSGYVRVTPNRLQLPEKPKGASFFVQQADADTNDSISQ